MFSRKNKSKFLILLLISLLLPKIALGQEPPPMVFDPAATSNYTDASRTAADIQYIVIHTGQGSYTSIINTFQNSNSNVSTHYVISSNGDITQMVLDRNIAKHLRNNTIENVSIGIEHEGFVVNFDWATPLMQRASARLVKYLCEQYNIPRDREHILGHGEIPG